MSERQVEWTGGAPDSCQASGIPINDSFVDGNLQGMWGCYHPKYYKEKGGRLGLGLGQRYEKRGDRWVKVEG